MFLENSNKLTNEEFLHLVCCHFVASVDVIKKVLHVFATNSISQWLKLQPDLGYIGQTFEFLSYSCIWSDSNCINKSRYIMIVQSCFKYNSVGLF